MTRVTRYVALLRGINLGPARRVAMPALRELAAGLGYADVATHLATGNLLLTTDRAAAEVRAGLERGLLDALGVRVDVVVRTADELAAALAANPFPDGDPSQVVLAFPAGPPAPDAAARIAALAAEDEPFALGDGVVYVRYGHGQAGSRLAPALADLLGVSATARTLRTVTALVARCR